MNAKDHRTSEHPVSEIFLKRWSPRAMSGEQLPREVLFSLFEAAKWAPSSANEQPWIFSFAMRETPHFQLFFDLLAEGNKTWCKNAAALLVICSRNNTAKSGKPNRTHSFDTGAAWVSLALEGSLRGLVVHGMAGFDYDRAHTALGLRADYSVEAMAAIGRPGKREDLPPDLQAREVPSPRKPLVEIIFEGPLPREEIFSVD